MTRYSVVIPTRNRVGQLQSTIESVLAQRCGSGFELIIVNDGSTDGTAGYLARLAASGTIRTVEAGGIGPSRARNRGAGIAAGEILAFTDDDCIVPADWLDHGGTLLESADAAGGGVRNAVPGSRISTVYHQMAEWFFNRQNDGQESALFLTTNNFFIRTALFRQLAGFSEKLYHGCEDREILLRLAAAGKRAVYSPQLYIHHHHAFTFSSYLRHMFMQGGGSRRFYKLLAPELSRKPNKLPVASYAAMFSHIAALDKKGLYAVNLLIAAAGQAAITAGYFLGGDTA